MKQAPTGHGSNSCSSKWMPSFSFEVPPLQLHLLEYPWSWISSWGPSWDAPLKFLFVLTLSQNKRKRKVRNMHFIASWKLKRKDNYYKSTIQWLASSTCCLLLPLGRMLGMSPGWAWDWNCLQGAWLRLLWTWPDRHQRGVATRSCVRQCST